ncbi:MAG: hypothetical protein JRI68_27755 [Deltaproteobacteria bacterium]|nr:hypothetical protein [Deltaproteobacteria bacterium]
MTHRWSWGDGPAELALIPPGFETVASGPSAVALTPGATPLILDRLAGRVVRVTGDGRLVALATVPVDAEELATSSDGSLITFSPLRATAWVYDADGQAAGELPVPRALHQLLHVELGPSRTVQVRTGYQELIDLGSSAAPLPLAVALKTKKEGAALLSDGRGLSASVTDGHAQLQVVRQATAEQHATVEAAHPIAGSVTAARIVGTFGTTACLRLERVESTPEITVSRRAFCVDVTDGTVIFDRELPAPGLYVPRRELAVGGGHLAFIHPTQEGLTLHRWRLDRGQGSKSPTVDAVTTNPALEPASGEEVQP